jgi:Domain of unknown function (DUF4160)
VAPALLRIGPYRIFVVAGDRVEPPHVHVERDDLSVKFWLAPFRLGDNEGFKKAELRRIERLVREHREELIEGWYRAFPPDGGAPRVRD